MQSIVDQTAVISESYPNHDSAVRPALIGAAGILVIALAFTGWSAFAPLASAVMAAGTVVVAENVKTIQSLEGGIVEAVMVHDGDVVRNGEVLLRLESGAQRSAINELSFLMALNEAEKARLRAEIAGSVTPTFSARSDSVDKLQYASMLKDQEDVFTTRIGSQALRRGELTNEKAGYQAALQGVEQEALQIQKRLGLAHDDIVAATALAKTGSGTIKAQRDSEAFSATLIGELVSLTTREVELHQEIRHCDIESQRLTFNFQESDQLELQKLVTEEQELRERHGQASMNLAHTVIRSPVAGNVMNESVHTIGGILLPGATILEVVPSAQKLVIESQVRPIDIDDVAVGSNVDIRSEGEASHSLPSVKGRVVTISADHIVDRARSDPYFLVSIEVNRAEMLAARGTELRPGIPVDVMITKRSQSLIAYLCRPLLDAFIHAMKD